MASIDSVADKVIWSAQHLIALKAEIPGYLNNEPCEVTAEAEPGTNRLISRLRTKVPIPVSIPLRIGDCFQNLRSALDYLVWELVLAAGNIPTNEHQFPICNKAEAFKDAVKRGRLKRISPEALAEIERFQPYHTSAGGALKLINDFANINKQRKAN